VERIVRRSAATEAGRHYFESLRNRLVDVEELRGMVSFGLPAYETDDGSVVFLRDGKTLHVDATALPTASA
jgi:hypothetical protein